MNEEEMYAFEEEHGLPHFPKEPPPPADPKNITREEAQASVDHMAEMLMVMSRQETIIGDHDKARVYQLASEQIRLLGQAIMAGASIDPDAWNLIINTGLRLTSRAQAVAARDDDD
jgi:hypothetical protein